MFLNPIIHIILAGLALAIGAMVPLDDSRVLLRFVPFLFFLFMFCLTLLRPVNQGPRIASDRYRVRPKPSSHCHKLTAADLHAMRSFGRQH